MATKSTYYLAVFIGSSIGGTLPLLWGDNWLSFSSILLSGLGGIAGIYIVWKFLN